MHETLQYIVDPFDLGGHRLRVTLHIPRVSREDQVVAMPAWIPGSYLIRDFARHIETIRGYHSGQWHAPVKLDDHRWVFAGCRDNLTVEIVVYAWDLSVRGAHVDDTHAFFNGTSVFLMPEGLEHSPCCVKINKPTGKRSWRCYTSMPEVRPSRGRDATSATESTLLGRFEVPDYDALIDHPFELGTPQVIEFEACGAKHQMVFTGYAPNIDLQRIARDTKRICEAQIRLFEPETQRVPFLDSAPRYVFMTHITSDGCGGLEHRASTALVASRKDLPLRYRAETPEGYTTFLGLVSHEYFHTWHVKRIKPAVFVPYNLFRPNHTRLLWVFEGFTSYYDDLMLVRSGVIGINTYLSQLSKTISSVHAGAGRLKQSLADSSFDAWTKYYKQDENAPNAISSYYAKGSLVALGLDLVIRQRSGLQYSLDDVMVALWQRYGEPFYKGKPDGLKESELVDLIKTVTQVDVSQEIEAWVNQTEDVPLQDLMATEGFDLQWVMKDDMPDLGLTFKPQGDSLTIRQVLEGGAAHRAGLSSGDILVAINGLRIDNSVAALKEALRAYRAGDRVTVHYFRADCLRTVSLQILAPAKAACQIVPLRQ